jgi:hypothetical protein
MNEPCVGGTEGTSAGRPAIPLPGEWLRGYRTLAIWTGCAGLADDAAVSRLLELARRDPDRVQVGWWTSNGGSPTPSLSVSSDGFGFEFADDHRALLAVGVQSGRPVATTTPTGKLGRARTGASPTRTPCRTRLSGHRQLRPTTSSGASGHTDGANALTT